LFDHVTFPPEHDPRVSALYALNEIDVNAPAELVWELLVDAEHWASYFPPENRIRILSGEPVLANGTRFHRVTVGHGMTSIVREFVPGRRLAWSTTVDGDLTGSTAYHGWVVTPTQAGCHVLTEETLQGDFYLEEIGRKSPGALYAYHQDWVEMLGRAAEAKAGR
jgi:uncharacterized protein YndB with AHSA1/START domain